jgi:beta-lactamase class A
MKNGTDKMRSELARYKIATGVLLVLLVIASAYAIMDRQAGPSVVAKYPLLDPARNFTDQTNFFSTVEPLRKEMSDIVARYEAKGDRIGVYYEFLNTGANVSINQDERFWPASLSKMPTAFEVMKKVENGDWKLSDELVLFDDDKSNAFGDLYKEQTGTRFTIEALLKALLIQSDDTAHRILLRNTSAADFTDMTDALGLTDFYNNNYDITAKEYSRLFRSLYSASYLSRDDSSLLLSWLSQTSFDSYLASGIPEGVTFAHKIGIQDPKSTYLDSGIVYVPDRPYIITVMTDTSAGGGEKEAESIMHDLSKAAYDYATSK